GVVRAHKSLSCKGLVVTTQWATHRRGNIASGTVAQTELSRGEWQPGTEYRDPFEVDTATWPPTYYARILHVSHTIQARAKLSWAKDPTVRVEFPVWATKSPENLAGTHNARKSLWGILLWPLALALLVIFGAILFILVPIVLAVGGGI